METVSRPGLERFIVGGTQALAIVATGGVAAVLAGLGSIFGARLSILATLLIPLAIAIVIKPRLGVLLLIFALGFLEEFPGGLSDEVAERSARQPFYAATFGLPAVYPPDVLIGGLCALFLCRKLLWNERFGMRLDKIGAAMILLFLSMAISVLAGFAREHPFGPEVLDLSLLGKITLPESAARYIAVLQFKIYALLFVAYVLGLIYFRSERDIRDVVRVLAICMLLTVGLGALRLVRDPGMVRVMTAVIYDTASVTFMALAVFYVISKWACGFYRPSRAVLYAVFSTALMVLILLSFRRTLWGAILIATLILPFIVPAKGRGGLFMLMALGALLTSAVLFATPGGRALLESVLARAGVTHLDDASTLYRFSLMVWVVERFDDIPLLGWGLKPLWNEKIHIRFFAANLENVHSLYLWVLVRFGIVGLIAAAIAIGLILLRMREIWKSLRNDHSRILIAMVLVMLILYLFNGIFNPVYANTRLIVPLGLALALASRLPEIAAVRVGRPI